MKNYVKKGDYPIYSSMLILGIHMVNDLQRERNCKNGKLKTRKDKVQSRIKNKI